jgi:Raf kinase inhibitor-like YbhB/YbcL family protein
MLLKSQSFDEGATIPEEFAFAKIADVGHVSLSTNRNPQLEWSNAPAGTQSFALICHDYDVPSRGDDVNQDGREVPASLPRVDFFHWLLLDIPPAVRSLAAGSHSNAVTPRGKSGPVAPDHLRHGINSFTEWFAGDDQMRGQYYGYDGPAPPWNDALLHHYVFTLYALDVAALGVQGELTGPNIRKALAGHILGEAALTGTYTLNPRLHV